MKAADEAQRFVDGTPEGLVVKGFAQMRRGDIVSAESTWRAVLRHHPEHPYALQGLARVYSCVSRFQTARKHLLDAARQLPDDPRSLVALADNSRFGPEHVAALERALALLDPETEMARNLRIHIQRDKAYGDRRPNELASPWQRYEVKLTRVGDMDLRYTVRARFNGKTNATLLVDTGASGLLLSKGFGKRAGLISAAEESGDVKGIGDGKAKPQREVIADSVSFGDLEFRNVSATVMEKGWDATYDGIIGTDQFEDFIVILDMPQKKLVVEPHPDEAAPPDPNAVRDAQSKLPDGYHRFFRFGHMLLMPTSVNESARRMFILDTGAAMNLVDPDAVRSSTNVQRDSSVVIRGLQGSVRDTYRAQKMLISFGNVQQQNNGSYAFDLDKISDSVGVEVAGILGMPVLQHLRITIDYRDGCVRFEPKL